jgi:hypothetical protein
MKLCWAILAFLSVAGICIEAAKHGRTEPGLWGQTTWVHGDSVKCYLLELVSGKKKKSGIANAK